MRANQKKLAQIWQTLTPLARSSWDTPDNPYPTAYARFMAANQRFFSVNSPFRTGLANFRSLIKPHVLTAQWLPGPPEQLRITNNVTSGVDAKYILSIAGSTLRRTVINPRKHVKAAFGTMNVATIVVSLPFHARVWSLRLEIFCSASANLHAVHRVVLEVPGDQVPFPQVGP